MAATLLGDHVQAQQLFTRATELNPDLTLAWLGLGTSSTWLDDTSGVRRAVVQLRRLEPAHPQLPGLEEYLRGRGAVVP
jgi:Flp pilus assembly protein TadD